MTVLESRATASVSAISIPSTPMCTEEMRVLSHEHTTESSVAICTQCMHIGTCTAKSQPHSPLSTEITDGCLHFLYLGRGPASPFAQYDLDLVGKAVEAVPRSLLTQAEYVEDVYSSA